MAATVTVGLLTLGAHGLSRSARADSRGDDGGAREFMNLYQKAQLYEVEQLEVAFHHAGSYGGDIDAMMALWADDSTVTVGSTVYSGKDAIRGFFLAGTGGPFHNHWVGLTPAFKLTATLNGDTATISFQCDWVDASVTPAVVRSDRILAGTVKQVEDKWLFWHMNSLPASL